MDSLSEKKQVLNDVFFNKETADKYKFLNETFQTLLELIPEAVSGSFFELQGDYYVPIASYGHDPLVIKELKIDINEAFILLNRILKTLYKFSSVYVPSRIKDPNLSPETRAVFEKLGTLGDFYCIYAPIKKNDEIIGVVSVEKIDGHFVENNAVLIMKYYANLVTEYYDHFPD